MVGSASFPSPAKSVLSASAKSVDQRVRGSQPLPVHPSTTDPGNSRRDRSSFRRRPARPRFTSPRRMLGAPKSDSRRDDPAERLNTRTPSPRVARASRPRLPNERLRKTVATPSTARTSAPLGRRWHDARTSAGTRPAWQTQCWCVQPRRVHAVRCALTLPTAAAVRAGGGWAGRVAGDRNGGGWGDVGGGAAAVACRDAGWGRGP